MWHDFLMFMFWFYVIALSTFGGLALFFIIDFCSFLNKR